MKNRDLANLLASAAAFVTDPSSLSEGEAALLAEDLMVESERLYAEPAGIPSAPFLPGSH